MNAGPSRATDLLIGRYRVHDEIAAGGMATVHLGRLVGDAGFSRTVAIKRLHPYHANDPDIVKSFTDEARIAARIRHLNVVQTLDVIAQNGEVFLVMEYVHGEPLSQLIVATGKRKEKIPPRIVAAILSSTLHGLHAAHEAKDSLGRPLGVVHRDISPQNILVGIDGVARVLDFGIARAAGRAAVTSDGAIKGKVAYMAPEHMRGDELDRRADIYASGVVLWEALTCKRLRSGGANTLTPDRSAHGPIEAPSSRVPGLSTVFDEITLRALRPRPEERFPTALAMAEALEAIGTLATTSEIAAWVQGLADETLEQRTRIIERIENDERRLSSASITVANELKSPPEERTQAFPAPVETKPHQVEFTIKMTSTDLLRIPSPAPPPAPIESSPMRMPMHTVPLDPEQVKASGVFLPPSAPSLVFAPPTAPPPMVLPPAPPPPKPEGRETVVNLRRSLDPMQDAPSGARSWMYWAAWVGAGIVVFVLSAVAVALLMSGK